MGTGREDRQRQASRTDRDRHGQAGMEAGIFENAFPGVLENAWKCNSDAFAIRHIL